MEETKTMEAPQAAAIGAEQVKKLTAVLQKYKTGEKRTEKRIVASENWWKLRNDAEESGDSLTMAKEGFKSASGWLHNVIVSKHADAMEAYPEPNILPREEDDRAEAHILTAIIPCVLEQNQFEKTYSDVAWQKIKSGTGVYKVVWDKGKLNGLGDITISKVNLLNLYWEPGITDIQRSRYFFHTELMDKDLLEEQYPEQLKGKLTGQSFLSTRFLYDDTVSTDGKVTVVECYYHKYVQGRKTVQYVKYVNEQVIFATENDPALARRGLYDHAMYPYVFDALFPIEGSPCGYGFVDICRNPQTCIDLLNTSFVKNAMSGATPRYFKRQDGGVNEKEFLDLTKSIVNVNGNLGEDSLRQIPFQPLDGVYVNYLDRIIQELRETSGNTETATGSTSSGVTAASAIAALQEASGKGSRDSSLSAYRAYTELVNLSIELIRQFYDMPRKFRIVGQYGMQQYITYDNSGLKPQAQLSMVEGMGDRLPVFDVKVSVMQKVSQSGTIFQKLIQYMHLSLQLAAKAAPEMVQGLSNDIMQTMGVTPTAGGAAAVTTETDAEKEPAIVENARARSNDSAQPDGGAVTGRAKDK